MTVRHREDPIAAPLESRLETLEREIIPQLELEFAQSDDEATHATLLAAQREADDIREALERALAASNEPWDEQQIEVGDVVQVREVGSDDVQSYVLVTGGSTEIEQTYGREIASAARFQVQNLIGKTTLKQLLAILQRASVVLCASV